jgi:hypothetical protein
MLDNLHIIVEMTRRDPLAVLGFLLIGASGVLFVHIQFKMRAVGYDTYPLLSRSRDWKLPAEYLRIKDQHGWSLWPAYLVFQNDGARRSVARDWVVSAVDY